MRKIRVSFRPAAQDDLEGLFDFLRVAAGARVANGYVERVLVTCLGLSDFPSRGAPRNDLHPGIRMIGFERRVTIFYRVSEEVEIVRVLYAGRDVGAALSEGFEP